jgi:hypothetical protein
MSSNVERSVCPLLRLGLDELLYLDRFLSDRNRVLLASTCRQLYYSIAKRSAYWRHRYLSEFSLDDWRERCWLLWFNEQLGIQTPGGPYNLASAIQAAMQAAEKEQAQATSSVDERTALQTTVTGDTGPVYDTWCASSSRTTDNVILDDDKLEYDWSVTPWYHAYHRRRLTSRNMMRGRWHEYTCQLPVEDHVKLYLHTTIPWGSLVGEQHGRRLWFIRHNPIPHKQPHTTTSKETVANKKLYWFELDLHISEELGDLVKVFETILTVNHLVIWGRTRRTSTPSESGDMPLSNVYNVILLWSHIHPRPVQVIHSQPATTASPPEFLGTNAEWMLIRMRLEDEATSNSPRNYRYLVYDLTQRRWCASVCGLEHQSYAHIQTTTLHRCDFAIFHLIPPTDVSDGECGSPITIRWQLFGIRPRHDTCITLAEDTFSLPNWRNPTIQSQVYGCHLAWIIIYDREDRDAASGGNQPHALLALVDIGVVGSSPTIREGQRRVLWSRPVGTMIITGLYQQNLIVIQEYRLFEVLDARNGTTLRRIPCEHYHFYSPLLDSTCALLSGIHGNSWFVDMATGSIKPVSSIWPQYTLPRDLLTQSNTEMAHTPSDTLPGPSFVDSGYQVSLCNTAQISLRGGGTYCLRDFMLF